MAVNISGDTGIDKITDGSIVTADFASGAITGSILPAGSILQVVQDTKTDTFSTTSTSFVEVTGLSVSITPSSASNKILLISTFMGGTLDSDTAYIAYTLYRDATNLGNSTYGLVSSRTNLDGFSLPPFAISYLDSPSTTSAITYKMYMKSSGGETAFVNRTDYSSGSSVATLIALEVAG